jgi:hypothetical protein
MSNGNGGAIGSVTKVAQSLIGVMPPAFLLLLILNLMFLGFAMWFLEDQLTQRDKMAEQLFNRCMDTVLRDKPQGP